MFLQNQEEPLFQKNAGNPIKKKKGRTMRRIIIRRRKIIALCLYVYRIPFLKARNEVHVQTHGKEFLLPNDLTSHLMDHVNLKNCTQELQPVVSPQSESKSEKS